MTKKIVKVTENELYLGDCLYLMNGIEDKSVDMILCDLPYGILNKPKNKWDSVIPFEPLWEQYNRIIKDNGAIVLFGQGIFTADLITSNKKMWRYNLVWKKAERTSGFLNANRMPMRNHEDIIVFYKKQPTYNPQKTTGHKPSHKRGKKALEGEVNNCYGDFTVFENRDYGDEKFPKSVINIDKEHPSIFPTQKPVELCEWLIKTYTNEGELVLDNCVGSGSTILGCQNTKRRWIGIELNEDHFNLANGRIIANASLGMAV